MASAVAPCRPPLRRPGDPVSSLSRTPAPSCGKRRRLQDDDESRTGKKPAVEHPVVRPVACLSCARIRPFVVRRKGNANASAPVCRDDGVIETQKPVESIPCPKMVRLLVLPSRPTEAPAKVPQEVTRKQKACISKIKHAAQEEPRPKVESKKQKAGGLLSSTRIRPVPLQASRPKKDVTAKKQKAAGCKSIPRCAKMKPAVPQKPKKDLIKASSTASIRVLCEDAIKAKQEACREQLLQATSATGPPQIPARAAAKMKPDLYAPENTLRAAIAAAREARDRAHRLQRQREEARREMDKMVQTVFFDDPYIAPEDALIEP